MARSLPLLALVLLALAGPAVAQSDPRLYYEADGEGPPVVFVPDWAHDTSTWFHLLPALRRGRTLVRYDLRGQGHSAVPADGDYSLEAHRDDLLSVLDGLGIGRANVVAAGLGARIALAAAAARPDRFASITLVEPNLAWTPEDAAWWGRFLAGYERAGRPSLGAYAPLLVGHWYDLVSTSGRPWLIPFYDLMLRRQDAAALVAALEAWLATDLPLAAGSGGDVPVLLVRTSRVGEPPGGTRLQTAFRMLHRAFLGRRGWIPQIDDPVALGERLDAFLPVLHGGSEPAP